MRAHAVDAALDDVVIVNTCAVTNEALRQAGQQIRKLRRENPDARIIVTGCAAQIDPERFANMSEVDHVIGNAEKMRSETFRSLARSLGQRQGGEADGACVGEGAGDGAGNPNSLATTGSNRLQVDDIMSLRDTASHMIEGFGNRARAYVQVQNGCDHRCTFCIIPFGRGPSRSVPAGNVVRQIEKLVDNGHGEIVLTGVDITDYGADLPGEQSLGTLCRQILRHVPRLQRLRLSSIDSVECDAHLLDVIATEPRLMPHLHLSLQAGDDMILKRMKRRHLRADSIRFCQDVRRLRPDVVFGADLIAGFPTETEAMFDNTLQLIADCGLTYLHVFPFSPRQGTPAAKMPQLPRQEVKARAARLRAKGDEALGQYLSAQTGRRIEVMLESANSGRTPHFSEVSFDFDEVCANRTYMPGSLLDVRVSGHDGRRLSGEVISIER